MSRLKAALIIASAATLAVTSAVPAAAAPDETVQAIRALDQHDLLTGLGASAAAGDVSATTGVTVGSADAAVSLRPETSAAGVVAAGGSTVVYHEDGYQYAVTGQGAQADAGYAIIPDASAPSEYRFDVDAGGQAAQLELTADGGVLVKNAAGETVNALGAAWALDANGAAVGTWYTLDGSTVVQHVDHVGAAYPVVADPRLLCDWVYCTVMYNKAETQQIAASNGTAGILITTGCSMLAGPIGALACGFASAYVGQQATTALNQGKCIGMRALIYVPMSTTHLVIEPC